MVAEEELTESMEDYLEAIYELSKETPARVRDLSKRLGVSMASVSERIKRLRERGLVTPGHYDVIQLTPAGEAVAAKVLSRHKTLRSFLRDTLGIEPDIADKDACRIEHSLSRRTIERIREFQEFFNGYENARVDWLAKQKK